MRVENKRTYRGPGVYIGRPSKWGNPLYITADHDRAWVVRKYEEYVRNRLADDPTWLDDLRGASVLICWCAPLPCHGDVLVRLIEELDNNQQTG